MNDLVIDKIDKLIDLAVNPSSNEHEARNAALYACKLLRENGYFVTDRQPKRRTNPEPVRVAQTAERRHECAWCSRWIRPGQDMCAVNGSYFHVKCARESAEFSRTI